MFSKFEKMSQKNLKKILSLMDEYIDRRGNPKQVIDYRNDRAIMDALDVIGLDVNQNDMNFLTQLRIENPDFETEEIKIPTLKVIEVITERYATIRVKEWWSRQINTYVDEDNLSDFLEDMVHNEWWDGEKIDEEILDEETTSSEVAETNRIS
jgi:hypothetical protein